jgi:hypothetical protein
MELALKIHRRRGDDRRNASSNLILRTCKAKPLALR